MHFFCSVFFFFIAHRFGVCIHVQSTVSLNQFAASQLSFFGRIDSFVCVKFLFNLVYHLLKTGIFGRANLESWPNLYRLSRKAEVIERIKINFRSNKNSNWLKLPPAKQAWASGSLRLTHAYTQVHAGDILSSCIVRAWIGQKLSNRGLYLIGVEHTTFTKQK